VGADHRAVEHLDQMRGLAQFGQGLEKGLEHTALAQPPKSLPHAVPVPELLRQSPPRDIVDREIVHRFQKLTIIAALVTATRTYRPEQG
jgi:hypothetical protein